MRRDTRDWLNGMLNGVQKHVDAVQQTLRLHDTSASDELDGIKFCLNRASNRLGEKSTQEPRP